MQALPRSASKWLLRSLSSAPLSSSRTTFICASCRSLQHQQSHVQSQRQRRTFASGVPLREQTQSDSSSSTPHPAAQPPSSGYARLRTRRLISISGTDAPHFLQGLITTGIEGNHTANLSGAARPTGQDPVPWFYCGFLNALGRVLHDVFIYPLAPGPGGEPRFVIEVDAAQLTTLLKHLKRYKLRSRISLRAVDEDEMSVWQIWRDGADTPAGSVAARPDGRSTIIMIPDLRAPDMGYRVLAVGGAALDLDLDAHALDLLLPADWKSAAEPEPEPTDEAAYRVRRYLRGVPEGSAEIVPAQALPLESNMDVMGGVDFRKGCYVGQELTIRTRHRGVVRKRILPCALYGDGAAAPTALEYRPGASPIVAAGGGAGGEEERLRGLTIGRLGKKGRSTGTFLAGVGNVGLALCRVQLMTDLVVPNDTAALEFDPAAEFVLQPGKDGEGEAAGWEVGAVKVKAFVPEWLRRRLDEDTVGHQA
ncbi:Aminomethyltransferase folate-binding domain-containing protein [Nemania serpens]|nr:Aminomethyltransferase folate-binding domain-containing protein [Nemania serpens]